MEITEQEHRTEVVDAQADAALAQTAATLLNQQLAAQYVFNGTALALEQSGDNSPPAPQLLEKLHALAEGHAITLADDGTTITSFDLRALESFASTDIVQGLEQLTDLQFDVAEIEDESPGIRRRVHFKGVVSPAQLARLYRLNVRNDLNIQMLDASEDLREAKARAEIEVWGDIDPVSLNEQASEEDAYREQGAEASRALSADTGQQWLFDGMNVFTEITDADSPFMAVVERLAAEGVIEHAIVNGLDCYGQPHTYCCLMNADLLKLRETANANLQQIAESLNSFTPAAPAWQVVNSRLVYALPEEDVAAKQVVDALKQLQDAGMLHLSRIAQPDSTFGHAVVDPVDFQALRNLPRKEKEQATDAAPLGAPAPTISLQQKRYDGALQAPPPEQKLDMNYFTRMSQSTH